MKSFVYRYYLIILIPILSCSLSSCKQDDPGPVTIPVAIDNIVVPYIVLGADVGILVGTIKDGQKNIYSFGEKEIGSKEKMTAQSVLEVASLTKIFTSVALADMHLKGDLNLDTPIENYLPNTVRIPSFNGNKITLRHLANHTSGFPRDAENMDKNAYNKYSGYTEQKMYDFINGYSLTREPGSTYEYSNVGYGLLGQILSLQSNSNYETMISNRVLQPLNMVHTTVSFTPNQMENLVLGYNGNEQVESWSKYMQNITQGTGSLISSLDDMLIYLEANMGLKSTSLDSAMALSHNLSFQFSGNHQDGIGLGWSHFTVEGQNIIWKNGGNGGYTSFMGFDKANEIGVVILINSSLNPDIFQTDIGFEILKTLETFK